MVDHRWNPIKSNCNKSVMNPLFFSRAHLRFHYCLALPDLPGRFAPSASSKTWTPRTWKISSWAECCPHPELRSAAPKLKIEINFRQNFTSRLAKHFHELLISYQSASCIVAFQPQNKHAISADNSEFSKLITRPDKNITYKQLTVLPKTKLKHAQMRITKNMKT